MTVPELCECGFSIDTTHEPIWPYNKFDVNEKTDQYYQRCHEVTKEILKRHEMEGERCFKFFSKEQNKILNYEI